MIEDKDAADLKPIFDLAMAYDPRMGFVTFRDTYIPRLWLNNGAHVKLDILPVMNDSMKRYGSIRAFSYFTDKIMESKDRREARELAAQAAPAEPGQTYDIEKLKAYMAKGIPLTPRQKAQLKQHEEDHQAGAA